MGARIAFCKITIEKEIEWLLEATALGTYPTEVFKVLATCIAAYKWVYDIAELEFAFLTFPKTFGMADRRICRIACLLYHADEVLYQKARSPIWTMLNICMHKKDSVMF